MRAWNRVGRSAILDIQVRSLFMAEFYEMLLNYCDFEDGTLYIIEFNDSFDMIYY